MDVRKQDQAKTIHDQPPAVHGQPPAVHGPPQDVHGEPQVVHDPPPPYSVSISQPGPTYSPYPFPPPVATAVHQHRLAFAGPPSVGSEPTLVTCPYCHAVVLTRVEAKASDRTHTKALILLILGGLLCFWIPYVVDSCKSKRHFCPCCGAYIGTYDN